MSNSSGCRKVQDETLRYGGGFLELLGLAHIEFQIIPNKSQRHIHAWWEATL
jgi:hypothetical protein